MNNDFKDLGVSENIVNGLLKQEIFQPTEIQKLVIPRLVEKQDIIACSMTGSGKTLAYLIPVFEMIDIDLRTTQALILTPTHELAAQVFKQAELLSKNSESGVKSVLIIGGANIERQIEKLKEKPQLVIGSAGRILDLIKKKKIYAHTVKTIIIDEADRMIDDLNLDGVKAVIKTTLKERQIVLFSASIDKKTIETANGIMKSPLYIEAKNADKLPEGINHFYILSEHRKKLELIRKIAHSKNAEKIVIFINNPENIEVTVEKLVFHGLKAVGLYGGIYKSERKNAFNDFKEGRADILVCSDIGARGIDIKNISHIINLDIPEDPVYYLHRAGRTGRNGEKGTVISLVTFGEKKQIKKYEKAFGIVIEEREMSFGELKGVSKTKDFNSESKSVKKVVEKNSLNSEKEIGKDYKGKNSTDNFKNMKQENKEKKGFFALKAEKAEKKRKNKN